MKVLFVCLGNICRSPTAEGVLRAMAARDFPGVELTVDSAGTADQHMIGSRNAVIGQRFPGEGTKPALHPVADDRISDLLRDGEADADRRVVIAARADEQDETGHGGALAAVGGEEIRALD